MRNFVKNSIRAWVFGLVVLALALNTVQAEDYLLNSPDGKIAFVLHNPDDVGGVLKYSVQYEGKTIISPSQIDVHLTGHEGLMEKVNIVNAVREKVNQTHTPLYGQRKTIIDNYRQTTFEMTGKAKVEFQLIVRAYDNSVAFRYVIPSQDKVDSIIVNRENTEFRMAPDARAWFSITAQGWITPKAISDLPEDCERPLVVELPGNGPVIALGEAGLIDFARTKFNPLEDGKGVVTAMHSEAGFSKSWRSPFRYLLVAPDPV